jgi:hypothetical protein
MYKRVWRSGICGKLSERMFSSCIACPPSRSCVMITWGDTNHDFKRLIQNGTIIQLHVFASDGTRTRIPVTELTCGPECPKPTDKPRLQLYRGLPVGTINEKPVVFKCNYV